MKKVLPLLVIIGACTPDIAHDPAPPGAISVVFDLSKKIAPQPNDLAKDPTTGKIVVPPSPTDTAAQKEFNEKFLGQLDGFPFEASATVSFTGDLSADSVPNHVMVLDLTDPAGSPPAVQPFYEAATKSIVVPPPSGAWTRGHRYAIALVGGAKGLRGAKGEDVIGSESWALVSGKTPLVTCADPKNLDSCTLFADVIPSAKTDPAEKLRDEKSTALQLEQIRLGYSQILDGLTAKGVDRSTIPQLWTFSIVDSGEVTFDPADSVIPFPNDAVRDPSTGKVNLPNPKTGKPLAAADCKTTDTSILLYCGLNSLDGFSTLAPPVSENSDTLGALTQGTLAGGTLTTTNVGLIPLKPGAPTELQTKPQYTPCLNCLSSKDANGAAQTSPQQLQWKLDAPLDEKTTYAAYVTTDPKDDKGRSVIPSGTFALIRSSAPLVENGKAAVNIRLATGALITDEQASQLEQLRLGYKPMFDVLETLTIHRENLALAWPFTTQSTTTELAKLQGYPAAVPGLPDYPFGFQDKTAAYTAAANANGIPITAIAKFFAGAFFTPVAVTGPGGTFNVANPAVTTVRFAISVPAGAPPAGGWPVLVFGHGFTRGRNDFLPFANAAASTGRMVIAIDQLFHGDRSSCTGSTLATKQTTDDAACADPTTMKCDEGAPTGRCVLRNDAERTTCTVGPAGDGACLGAGQGECAADGKCQGAGAGFLSAADGVPVISGWNHLNPGSFLGTRDNIRQGTIDTAQLIRVLKGTDAAKSFALQLAGANGGALPYSTTKIDYAGMSLGGIQGTLFASVSPDVHKAVLNVPGGAWTTLLMSTVSFAPIRDALLQGLAAQGLVRGTPKFDTFMATAQWMVDAADPANFGYRLTHSVDVGAGVLTPPSDHKAFIQFIEGDEAVPNVSTFALLKGANRSFSPVPPGFACAPPLYCYEFTQKGDNFDATTATPDSRHGFLLKPPTGTAGLTLTQKAQTQAATFLATGALP